jgi:lytic cellulose monooxygenase (C1-hydroxylating)
MQLPSDIKPGTYIFRTELLALHGNAPMMASGPLGGPQFYPHCFNVEISGTGTETPEGVTIPGAYHQNDLSITLDVWAKKDDFKRYVSN